MAAPLITCTNEQCVVIQCLWCEGVTGTEIHQRLHAHLHPEDGNSKVLHVLKEMVYMWLGTQL
jgi:hypothetical protein